MCPCVSGDHKDAWDHEAVSSKDHTHVLKSASLEVYATFFTPAEICGHRNQSLNRIERFVKPLKLRNEIVAYLYDRIDPSLVPRTAAEYTHFSPQETNDSSAKLVLPSWDCFDTRGL